MFNGLRFAGRMLVKSPGVAAIGGRTLSAMLFLAAFAGNAIAASPLLEDVLEESYPFTPTGTLSIHNTEGAIRIYGSSGDDLKIVAIKRAYSQERLDAIQMKVDAKPDSISIDTIIPPRKKWGLGDRSGTVEYLIYIPQTASVTRAELGTGEVLVEGLRGATANATLGTGRLYSHNCFADAKLSVATGGLDISFDWWESREFKVDAQIASGGIRAWIPSDASFNLAASADSGNVASDFTEKEQRKAHASSIRQTFGEGPGADFHLHATSGNIKISQLIW